MELLLQKVSDYVADLFRSFSNPKFVYHNFKHTLNVVNHANEILDHINLPGNEQAIVIIAAWFHDTGHLFNIMQGHEKKSTEIMDEFLSKQSCDRSTIDEIASCILATTMPARPSNLKEEILCDADTYHLGTTEFPLSDALIKLEVQQRGGTVGVNWDLQTLEFLRTHRFYTSYCKENLGEGKALNIASLLNKITAAR